jgi:hypothetical protein
MTALFQFVLGEVGRDQAEILGRQGGEQTIFQSCGGPVDESIIGMRWRFSRVPDIALIFEGAAALRVRSAEMHFRQPMSEAAFAFTTAGGMRRGVPPPPRPPHVLSPIHVLVAFPTAGDPAVPCRGTKRVPGSAGSALPTGFLGRGVLRVAG